MPRQTKESLAYLFWLLSYPTRLRIVDILRHGDVCVQHLQGALKRSQANVSQHLTLLREAGIVETHHEGARVYYHLSSDRVRLVLNVLLGPPANHAWSDEGCCHASRRAGEQASMTSSGNER